MTCASHGCAAVDDDGVVDLAGLHSFLYRILFLQGFCCVELPGVAALVKAGAANVACACAVFCKGKGCKEHASVLLKLHVKGSPFLDVHACLQKFLFHGRRQHAPGAGKASAPKGLGAWQGQFHGRDGPCKGFKPVCGDGVFACETYQARKVTFQKKCPAALKARGCPYGEGRLAESFDNLLPVRITDQKVPRLFPGLLVQGKGRGAKADTLWRKVSHEHACVAQGFKKQVPHGCCVVRCKVLFLAAHEDKAFKGVLEVCGTGKVRGQGIVYEGARAVCGYLDVPVFHPKQGRAKDPWALLGLRGLFLQAIEREFEERHGLFLGLRIQACFLLQKGFPAHIARKMAGFAQLFHLLEGSGKLCPVVGDN